ncbi:MAG: C45 family autoproteolytic acyltransferase/hydrolase [Bacteroidales bacterium]|jgi:isopenicillin-N N-acyltransferase-like protein|nr:C45 family autoproteolytic acyltransferase/hydrolase [Bacteroidales bacterium]
MPKLKKIFKALLRIIIILIIIILILIAIFKITSKINPPIIENPEIENIQITQIDSSFSYIKNNWLKKNEFGLWEMYIEGEAYERGIIIGKLSKDLIFKQENAFVNQIKTMIPSESYLKFLKSFIGFFNRNIDKHIIDEYQKEIYGISKSASEKFNYIAPNYQRILNYHAAHDIGHALQNMNLVACTAFSGWDSRSTDSSLIVGRNFDFYVGDEFAEDKIIMFCDPYKGYKFMIVTWGGMIGATSGMNDQGLTVTLNAAKSDIPFGAATPISIVAREILQYASTIDEAYKIAKKRKTFVSESLFIGSAKDGRTATIEKSPDNQALLESDNDYIICSNHFQSTEMEKDEFVNAKIENYATTYRFARVEELLEQNKKLDLNSVAKILRDQRGLQDKDIGMGNEKAINQLIAHHSIIFKPEELKVWVSTAPFQLGEYICYDLNKVFIRDKSINKSRIYYENDLTIPADTFLYSNDYKNFNLFKEIRTQIQTSIKTETRIADEDYLFNEIIELNPEFFETYVYLGDYFNQFDINDKAILAYKKALRKEIPNIYQREKILEQIEN